MGEKGEFFGESVADNLLEAGPFKHNLLNLRCEDRFVFHDESCIFENAGPNWIGYGSRIHVKFRAGTVEKERLFGFSPECLSFATIKPKQPMKNSLSLLSLLLVPLIGFAGVETGSEAPDFTLVDTNGAEHSLSDFEGKFVVLEWLNHGCPFVVRHYNSGNIPSLQKKYTDEGVVWLSIVSSAPGKQGHHSPEEANELTVQKGAAPTAVLLDESGDVGRAYDARTTPQIFVIDPDGVLIYQGAIDDDKRGRKGDQATCYVTATLDSAMGGEEIEAAVTPPYGCSVKY